MQARAGVFKMKPPEIAAGSAVAAAIEKAAKPRQHDSERQTEAYAVHDRPERYFSRLEVEKIKDETADD